MKKIVAHDFRYDPRTYRTTAEVTHSCLHILHYNQEMYLCVTNLTTTLLKFYTLVFSQLFLAPNENHFASSR